MKKFAVILMALLCAASLAACSDKPTQEEVEQAIADGNITVEDALEKGWVTQEWADTYQNAQSVPAIDKAVYHAVGEFTAQTVSGKDFTRDDVSNVTFFAFIDPKGSEAETYYQELVKAYDGVKEAGADILVCSKDEQDTEMFADAPFPVIIYNDSVKEAMGNNAGMVEDMESTASWYVNGSFLSAWYGTVEAQDLTESAAGFVQMGEEKQNDSSSGDGTMAAMSMGA